MPLFSNTDQVGARYAAHIHEFRKLYEFHSLRSGTAQDFVQLAPKLASSEGFRLDFSDRVRRVRDRERGSLSAGEMLTIVGMAIGGAGIAGAELDLYESAGTVQVLLAGVGGWREAVGGLAGTMPEELPSSDGAADEEGTPEDLGGEERVQRRAATRSEMEAAWGGSRRQAAGGGGEVSPEMKEALARLEMASLQLKVYLDDIDRRMGRIEPHLDDLTAMVQTSAEQFQKLERSGRETHGEAPAGAAVVPEGVARRRRLRGDEAIAAAMEMASQEKQQKDAEPLVFPENAVAESAAEESAAAGTGVSEERHEAAAVIAPEATGTAAGTKILERFEAEDRPVEARGRPIGWARRDEAAAESKAAEEIPAAANPEVEGDGGIAATSGANEAAVEAPRPVGPRRDWRPWGAAAAVFLVAAGSLGYVYQPWHFGAREAVAEGASASAAGGKTEVAQGGAPAGSAVPVSGAIAGGRLPNGGAASSVPADAGRASAIGRRSESGARPGAQAGGAKTDGAASGTARGGGATSIPGAILTLPQTTAVVRTPLPADGTAADAARSRTEPPKDRVEGARAADVAKAPRLENLHPEGSAGGVAGGTPAHVEPAAMVSRASAPLAGGPSAGAAAAADVPRSTIGRPEVGASTLVVSVISAPQPIYPQQARQSGIEGKVIVQATVDKSGTVTSARVVDGPFLLRQSAQDAVLRRRYKPYLLHGDPAEFQTLVTLNYKLAK